MLGVAVVKMLSCVCAPLPPTVRLTHMNWRSEYVLVTSVARTQCYVLVGHTSVPIAFAFLVCARSRKCRRIIGIKLNNAQYRASYYFNLTVISKSVRKIAKSYLASSCLSVRPHGTLLPLDGFSWNSTREHFRKSVEKIHVLLKSWQECHFTWTLVYIFDVILTSSLICGNKVPTRCNRGFYCRSYSLLNMFWAPQCPSYGAQEYYTVVAACGIWCCGFQVAGLVRSWGLCVRFAGCLLVYCACVHVRRYLARFFLEWNCFRKVLEKIKKKFMFINFWPKVVLFVG